MKTYLKFSCVYCGQHLECDPALAGRQTHCPACLHRIAIPSYSGGNPANAVLRAPFTWDSDVPMPQVEIPTRYRRRNPANAELAM